MAGLCTVVFRAGGLGGKNFKIAGRAEASRDEPSRRGLSRAKPSRVEAKPSRAKPSRAEPEPKSSTPPHMPYPHSLTLPRNPRRVRSKFNTNLVECRRQLYMYMLYAESTGNLTWRDYEPYVAGL